MAGETMLADIRERLHKKSIHEVRLIARAVGVHSPTDGKKDCIIDKIIAIASCKAQPAPRSARGAPPKSNDFDEALVTDIRECIRFFGACHAGEAPIAQSYSVSDDSEQPCSGILDRTGKYAYLRVNGCFSCSDDIYVAETVINRFGLRSGDKIDGVCRRAASGAALHAIASVNGFSPDALPRRELADLTPVYPGVRICLGGGDNDICARMSDMFAPLGYGQRAVISAPASFGKISLIKQIAAAVCLNESAQAVILLVGGYPEEITDIRRSVKGAEVFSTSLSAGAEENARAAELVSQYCARMAECGRSAVLIVCGFSALGEAALHILSSAINAEEGGSLTVIGFVNAAGEYGSENSAALLSAANMRLVISDGSVPIDIQNSFTLGREYLQSAEELKIVGSLRKKSDVEVLNIFKNTADNAEIISNGR